jgi:hypothetical protein
MLAPPMPASKLRAVKILAWLTLGVTVGALGCAARSKQGASPTADTPTRTLELDAAKNEQPDDLESELSSYEARLRAAGIAIGDTDDEAEAMGADGGGATEQTTVDEAGARCTNICEIAAAICDLKTHVCDLATEHPDQPRYARVCERAEGDCTIATEACEGCDA